MTATDLRGEPIARAVRESVAERVSALADRGIEPTLGTVLMSDAPADERFLALKHDACAAVGIATRDRRIAPDAPAADLYDAVGTLSADPAVDGVFVQTPLPDHVDVATVGRSIDPTTDVDCFHPENRGRLVAGSPRFVPATTAAVCRLLAWYDVDVAGRDVVIVGRSNAIGKPLANRLLWDDEPGNATVTVCHSLTEDLGRWTRRADVLVTACGVPELIDGSMLSPGVVVVDVSANRVTEDGERTVVGDVDRASARQTARAITPVPGGVGPVTVSMLLANVVDASARGVDERH